MTIMNNIGIMCGRLSKQIGNSIQVFPSSSWKSEFQIANKCGFSCIEWIFDSNMNPISNNEGIKEMLNLSKNYNIKIKSICCDYFMENLLFNVSEDKIKENLKVLEKVIDASHDLGIKIVEIPLVDSSSLSSESSKSEFKKNMERILPLIEKNNMFLTLETDLKPTEFKEFLLKFDNRSVAANYDTGNSTALGYNIEEEFRNIGKFIKNIHIKDRKLHGETVKLGTGDTNFEKFFKLLSSTNYSGDLIIQGARLDHIEKPEITASRYIEFTNQYLHKHLK